VDLYFVQVVWMALNLVKVGGGGKGDFPALRDLVRILVSGGIIGEFSPPEVGSIFKTASLITRQQQADLMNLP
jgi:hypothetical protein